MHKCKHFFFSVSHKFTEVFSRTQNYAIQVFHDNQNIFYIHCLVKQINPMVIEKMSFYLVERAPEEQVQRWFEEVLQFVVVGREGRGARLCNKNT